MAASKSAAKAPAKTPAQDSKALAAFADQLAGLPTGMEHVTAEDMLIPRLTIIQSLSPQRKKGDPQFLPDAEEGDFCDTGTNELFKGELEILPVFFARVFLEWAPRGSGGGLVANHGLDGSVLEKTTRDENSRNVLPNGNYIAETATYFCLNLTAGGRASFIPLSGTQLKNSRRWMTLIKNEKLKRSDGTEFTPPIFFRSWIAEAAAESNAKGAWYGWKMKPGRTIFEIDPDGALLEQAKEFCTEAANGLVKGDFAGAAEEAGATQGDPEAM